MRFLSTAEIRDMYLKYFENKGCKIVPSCSLIPNDPSLLLTSAGMVQFKPYFLHVKEFDKAFVGATSVQKCVRTSDIENIGVTGRHLSFFEMLGNFSFGKYFKREMCAWAFEFCTSKEYLDLPLDKLFFTVYEQDDETGKIWQDVGVRVDHISYLDEKDNFWRAGPTGPCGPCSEIYFDQGAQEGCGKKDCKPGCDCGRYIEFWNLVFTQYDAQEDGSLKPLATKNIDTGMGLERMAAIMQGVTNNYDTDVLRSLISVGEKLAKVTYQSDPSVDKSLRIMADHSRSVVFMIGDGILPSNEGRGYVLRRLLRRAVMKAHLLDIDIPFFDAYVDEIIALMGNVYPEIIENQETIRMIIRAEEEAFGKTLALGEEFLNNILKDFTGIVPGKDAFKLHDTYGFPIEVTQEICEDAGVEIDMAEFNACMEEQRERARLATKEDSEAAWSTYGGIFAQLAKKLGSTKFVGYESLRVDGKVQALLRDGKLVNTVCEGEDVEIITDVSPFYAEMGGEVGDTGYMKNNSISLSVLDTQMPEKGLIVHRAHIDAGVLLIDDVLTLNVDSVRRSYIARNHTATHLLHAALRHVLGNHVAQKGSYVGADRLRFDFTQFSALSPEEIKKVEMLVNRYISKEVVLNIYETTLEEAREQGATALFGEKYSDIVRVVQIGNFSHELCGGCHVKNTSEIGAFKITSECGVASGVRRIEAVTGLGILDYLNKLEDELNAAALLLKSPRFEVAHRVENLQSALKSAQLAAKQGQQKAAGAELSKLPVEQSEAGYSVVISHIGTANVDAMRNAWDILHKRMGKSAAVVLASQNEGKALLLAAGTQDAVSCGFNAGEIIKTIAPLVGGGGGGKPTMAQAGGKDISGIEGALQKARSMVL